MSGIDQGEDVVLLPALPWRKFAAGLRRLADPKVSLASIASMTLGAAAAYAAGPMSWGWLALTVVGILLVEVAKNASGEVVDFDSGVDLAVRPDELTPFSGGKRVLVDRLLTRRQTITVAAVGYAMAFAVGLIIAFYREPDVLEYALAGVALAYFYHAGPVRLSHRGLGEIAVAVAYGPLICVGTYIVQRGHIAPVPLLLSIPLGLLIAGFLWANEFPDARADALSGKRTLVVRLGRPEASRALMFILVTAFTLLAALPFAGVPVGAWLGLVALGPAAQAARNLQAGPEDMERIVPAQAQMLMAFVLYAVAVALGLLIF
jgi:1,4-dihydroxy-2-naphthoate octaprenyltransferase